MKINLNNNNSNSELKDSVLLLLGVPVFEIEPSAEEELDLMIKCLNQEFDYWTDIDKREFIYEKMMEQIYIDGNVIALK